MLHFIVFTEKYIFSDLTHWLMTHDSLTHLTHYLHSIYTVPAETKNKIVVILT